MDDPRTALRDRTVVVQSSVFDLAERSFDLGTMFFVACSISSDLAEFHAALDKFMHSLTPKAPFALAFMAGSKGYPVGDKQFPAVQIDDAVVRRYLSPRAYDFSTHVIEAGHFREGYENMIVATGRVNEHA